MHKHKKKPSVRMAFLFLCAGAAHAANALCPFSLRDMQRNMPQPYKGAAV